MLIQEYDWKVGDMVKVVNPFIGAKLTGEIIGIKLDERDRFSYTIKVSDKRSIVTRSEFMSAI